LNSRPIVSAISAGRSWPSISTLTSLTTCIPPARGSAESSFWRARTREPTGTMLVKRSLLEP